MKGSDSRTLLLIALAGVLVVCVLVAAFLWRRERIQHPRLPYADSFASRQVEEWTPYGGTWLLDGDTVVAQALDRGAKLVAGSDDWSDYEITADVQLRGHGGDLGIAVRVNDPKIGIDAYQGYFAGLRFDDSSLTVGRADGHWLSVRPVYVRGGLRYKQWYHMRIVAVGCRIVVEVTSPNGIRTVNGLADTDTKCIAFGKIALRTTDSNGAWKNVSVKLATIHDLQPLLDKAGPLDRPQFPIHERDYSAMREQYLSQVPPSDVSPLVVEGGEYPSSAISNDAPLVKIDELRSHLWTGSPVRIVGVVTSSDPPYVQDLTAGIRLADNRNSPLQVGDEVEILGLPDISSSLIRLSPLRTRILWDRAPVIPLSVTATQVATGRYDGSLVDLSGVVRRKLKLPNGGDELLLQDGTQNYSLRLPFNLFRTPSLELAIGSRLRIRGICSTTETSSWPDQAAFVVLAGSLPDVSLVAGPPWWYGQRLYWIIAALAILIAAGVYWFLAIERSKLRIVHEERERLSHEMHDTLAQSLAGVGFKLQGIRRSMRASGSVPPGILEAVDATCETVASTHREASASIAALHPASLSDGDLLTLLERFVFSMVNEDSISVETQRTGDPRLLSPFVADTLFHIGREAIANSLRHAKATSIKISLAYRNRDLVLSITDDGAGFSYTPNKRGFGLQSIERRCADIKATAEILSTPGGGCTVRVTSPYRMHRALSRWLQWSVNRRS
jgi:signal transduction histidine kinase